MVVGEWDARRQRLGHSGEVYVMSCTFAWHGIIVHKHAPILSIYARLPLGCATCWKRCAFRRRRPSVRSPISTPRGRGLRRLPEVRAVPGPGRASRSSGAAARGRRRWRSRRGVRRGAGRDRRVPRVRGAARARVRPRRRHLSLGHDQRAAPRARARPARDAEDRDRGCAGEPDRRGLRRGRVPGLRRRPVGRADAVRHDDDRARPGVPRRRPAAGDPDCRAAMDQPLPDVVDRLHQVILGLGWCAGLAAAAALMLRETARIASEAYPRWSTGTGRSRWRRRDRGLVPRAVPAGLDARSRHGAAVIKSRLDPLAQLARYSASPWRSRGPGAGRGPPAATSAARSCSRRTATAPESRWPLTARGERNR